MPRTAAIVPLVVKRVGRSFQRTTWAHSRPKKRVTSRCVELSSTCTRESGPILSTVPSEWKRTLARPSRVTTTSSRSNSIAGAGGCESPWRITTTWPPAASSVANPGPAGLAGVAPRQAAAVRTSRQPQRPRPPAINVLSVFIRPLVIQEPRDGPTAPAARPWPGVDRAIRGQPAPRGGRGGQLKMVSGFGSLTARSRAVNGNRQGAAATRPALARVAPSGADSVYGRALPGARSVSGRGRGRATGRSAPAGSWSAGRPWRRRSPGPRRPRRRSRRRAPAGPSCFPRAARTA